MTVLPERTSAATDKAPVFVKLRGNDATLTPPIKEIEPEPVNVTLVNVCPFSTAVFTVIAADEETVLPERASAAIDKAPVLVKAEGISKGASPPTNVIVPVDVTFTNDWLAVIASVNVIAPVPVTVLPLRTADDILNSFVLFTKTEGIFAETVGASPPINVIVRLTGETLANDWVDVIASVKVIAPEPVTVLPSRTADDMVNKVVLFTKLAGIEAGVLPPINVTTRLSDETLPNTWAFDITSVKVIAPVPVTVLPSRIADDILNSLVLFTKAEGIIEGESPPTNVLTPVDVTFTNDWLAVTASVNVIAPEPVTVLPSRTADDILNSFVLFTKTEGIIEGASPPTNVIVPVGETLANDWVDVIASINVIAPEPVTVLPSRTADDIVNTFVLFTKTEGIVSGASPPINVIVPVVVINPKLLLLTTELLNNISPEPVTVLPERTDDAIVKAALFTKVAGIDAGSLPPTNVIVPLDVTCLNICPDDTAAVNVIAPVPLTCLSSRTDGDILNSASLFTKLAGMSTEALGASPPINIILLLGLDDEIFPKDWDAKIALVNLIAPEPVTILPLITDGAIVNSSVLFTKLAGIVEGATPPLNLILPVDETFTNDWDADTASLNIISPEPVTVLPLRTTDEIVKLFVLFTKVSGIEAGVTPPINVLTPVEALMPANVCPSITALVNVISPEPVTVLPERTDEAIVNSETLFTKVAGIEAGVAPPINVTTRPNNETFPKAWPSTTASVNVIAPVPVTVLPSRTADAIVKAPLFTKVEGIVAGLLPPKNVIVLL